MKTIAFSGRTIKELLRDPLSYIFCVGFPIIMLVIFTIVGQSMPAEAQVELFHISSLAPGIAIFGFGFVMLFTTIQVSKDRSTAFLMRLYASPMKAVDYIGGYTIPVVAIAVIQAVATFTAAVIIGRQTDYTFQIQNILLCILVLLPSALLFIGFGLFFGTLLNDKAAPGICSVIITLSCMFGGVWMDVDAIGGIIMKASHVLPFYQGTMAARYAIAGSYGSLAKPLLITLLYGGSIYLLSIFLFYRKMQKDLK